MTHIQSLLGEVCYERAYYRCPHCRQGWFPSDEELNVQQRQTPAAAEVISLAGVVQPFEEGADRLLVKLGGLVVSKSSVQRTTGRVGAELARRRAAGEFRGPERPWDWHRDAHGNRVAYLSLDATGVAQQGPDHKKAEGRMPWVAAVFNPRPMHEEQRRELREVRYLSGLMSLEEIGRQLRSEALAVGLSRADVVVGLTDGGNGLENCLIDTVAGETREIVFVLDFYHAAEHLREFAKTLFPEEAARKEQVETWCHRLKHEGGETLLEELRALDLSDRSAATREQHRELLGYLGNNRHRTNYPEYVAKGWQIGSGVIESACKSVVGMRMKGPGMRWREPGTDALCHLRALHQSQENLWDHYWHRQTTA